MTKVCKRCGHDRFSVYESTVHEAQFSEDNQCFEATDAEVNGIYKVICAKCDEPKDDWEDDDIQFVD